MQPGPSWDGVEKPLLPHLITLVCYHSLSTSALSVNERSKEARDRVNFFMRNRQENNTFLFPLLSVFVCFSWKS